MIFTIFSEYYSEQEIEQRHLVRVDSTMVAEAANKLKTGIEVGRKPKNSNTAARKQIKYTFAFDGSLPCLAEVFTHMKYTSESVAVPEVIYKYTEKNQGDVFVFDRGMESRQVMDQLSGNETLFVTRIKSNSRYKVEKVMENGSGRKVGILTLESDLEVRLPYRKSFLENNYRLIIAKNPQTGSVYYFLTNIFDMNVEQVIEYYKKRWDIEVFFRFLKQELNLGHITSTSENGMQVMLYMTMICSMLVLVYKRVNQVGYKTAVRRIALELNEYIIKLIVMYCGGDPSLVFR